MTDHTPLGFGPFVIDRHTLEVRRGKTTVPLEPLPTRILVRLVEDTGSMVSRAELCELGWPKLPGAAEQSLNTCVHQIRHALEASGPSDVRIETLRGRGYRLVAPIEDAKRDRRSRTWVGAAAMIALIAATGVWTLVHQTRPDAPMEGASHLLEQARYLTEETQNLAAAVAVLDTAVAAYPDNAAVQGEWAELHFMSGNDRSARLGARRALELDRRSATALRVEGGLAMMGAQWEHAEEQLEQARESDPTDTRTLAAFAYLRTIQGRFDEAQQLVAEAVRLDPLSANIRQDAGLMYLLTGDYALADTHCREVLRFRPESTWALECLFDAALLAGRDADAAEWGARLLDASETGVSTQATGGSSTVQAVRSMRTSRWEAAVAGGAPPLGLAMAYAAEGRTAEAIDAIQQAVQKPAPGLLSIAVDPRLRRLHALPQFTELVQRLGLPATVAAS